MNQSISQSNNLQKACFKVSASKVVKKSDGKNVITENFHTGQEVSHVCYDLTDASVQYDISECCHSYYLKFS